jgi:hypothetical protein
MMLAVCAVVRRRLSRRVADRDGHNSLNNSPADHHDHDIHALAVLVSASSRCGRRTGRVGVKLDFENDPAKAWFRNFRCCISDDCIRDCPRVIAIDMDISKLEAGLAPPLCSTGEGDQTGLLVAHSSHIMANRTALSPGRAGQARMKQSMAVSCQ